MKNKVWSAFIALYIAVQPGFVVAAPTIKAATASADLACQVTVSGYASEKTTVTIGLINSSNARVATLVTNYPTNADGSFSWTGTVGNKLLKGNNVVINTAATNGGAITISPCQ